MSNSLIKLVVKLCLLISLSLISIGLLNPSKSDASTTCPAEVYESCWQEGTLYIVDSTTCSCYCPTNSGLCNTPSNPTGVVDQSTCTCSDITNYDCDPSTASICTSNGGTWDNALCICHY